MDRVEIETGIGYFNLNIQLKFDNCYIDLVGILDETHCISFTGVGEDLYHLIFYKTGGFMVDYGSEVISIQPETFLLKSPDLQHNEVISEGNLVKYHIYFNVVQKKHDNSEKHLDFLQQEAMELYNLISRKGAFQLVKDKSGEAANIFRRIINELESQKLGSHHLMDNLFNELFFLFARAVNGENFEYKVPIKNSSINSLSYKMSSYVSQHYEKVSLGDISKTFNISQRQAQRIFKATFGISFMKRLYEIRIQNAKILLADSDLTILEIANKVGFNSTSYFGKIFNEQEKITPNQFRKKSRL